MAGVDDRTVRVTGRRLPAGADEQPRDLFNRLLCGTKADALTAPADERIQPFQR